LGEEATGDQNLTGEPQTATEARAFARAFLWAGVWIWSKCACMQMLQIGVELLQGDIGAGISILYQLVVTDSIPGQEKSALL
jgi:hypothetical protein